ncbi:MAG: hypothetical protein QFB87_01635 [Patescibacteria group bacterium]|nr:hypothetical protein [Patescibacteria group bacterium]
MTTANKDTIYIDIDEEITGIIDKVRSSDAKIVALVLPKRASVLQSIVNMKLLKRSADEAKKHLVLITSEAGLLPLAGAVGLHVAKTPQSKPEVPVPPVTDDNAEETIDEANPDEFSTAVAATRPIGELAGLTAAPIDGDELETLQLDDDEEAALAASSPVVAADTAKAKKVKKNSKLAVPNFERFRLLLVLGVLGVIALVVGLIFALSVLPKAEIAITTNASDVNVGLDLNLSTAAKAVDPATNTLPAKLTQQQKSYTQTAPATGTKNNGQKATGSVTLSLTNCDHDTVNIPSGTGISANGNTYITQETVTLSSVKVGGKCNPGAFSNVYSQDTKAIASKGGAVFNVPSGTTMAVAAGAGYVSSDVKGVSSTEFSGGTDDNVKIVTQSDIDSAKAKISAGDTTVKSDLRKQLEQDGLYAVTGTYSTGTPSIVNSAEANAVADAVTVTETINYSMFGVKQADLKSFIENSVKTQIDTAKQSILSDGLDTATFKVTNSTDTAAAVTLQAVATAGPDLKVDDLKRQVAGKKGGDIKRLLQSNPGVTDVQTKLSPFWVSSVPKKTTKITVIIAKPTTTTNSNATKP